MEREDVRMSLMSLAHTVQKMDEERWKLFKDGNCISVFITDSEWQLPAEGGPKFEGKTLTLTFE